MPLAGDFSSQNLPFVGRQRKGNSNDASNLLILVWFKVPGLNSQRTLTVIRKSLNEDTIVEAKEKGAIAQKRQARIKDGVAQLKEKFGKNTPFRVLLDVVSSCPILYFVFFTLHAHYDNQIGAKAPSILTTLLFLVIFTAPAGAVWLCVRYPRIILVIIRYPLIPFFFFVILMVIAGSG